MEVQPKNANDGKAEEKVRVRKNIRYYEFSSKDKSGKQAELKNEENQR